MGNFLGHGHSLEFVEKEMKIRWNLEGLQDSALFDGLFLLHCPSEEAMTRVLDKGSWSLAGQLLALEPWRPGFRPGW